MTLHPARFIRLSVVELPYMGPRGSRRLKGENIGLILRGEIDNPVGLFFDLAVNGLTLPGPTILYVCIVEHSPPLIGKIVYHCVPKAVRVRDYLGKRGSYRRLSNRKNILHGDLF